MEHVEAQESHAVERYILNEMSESERDRFEEHYFDCRICAEEVTEATRFLDSGRVVAREAAQVVPIESRRAPFLTWMPLAAAAMLLVVASVLVIPKRSAPSMDVLAPPQQIAAGVSRAGNEPAIVLRAGAPGVLFVDIAPDPPFPNYEILIRNSAGNVLTKRAVSAEQTHEAVPLLLRSLPAGSYVLTIDGVRENGNRTEIANRPFRVQ